MTAAAAAAGRRLEPDGGAAPPSPLGVIETAGFADYALLDSGAGRKLERFGAVTVDRPEPQAMWRRRDDAAWSMAHAVFAADDEAESGRWRQDRPVPEAWPVQVAGVTVNCRLGSFRHLGLFPEQLPHWQWMLAGLAAVRGERPRVLNLFAYTGAASLIAARAGAEVTHVDASKKAIAWARENQQASGLASAPIRWILDDARKFVLRDVRRGKTYHAILIDPPKFGRGPAHEVWELFEHLPDLLAASVKLLAARHAMLVVTAYAIRASALAIGQLTREAVGSRGGRFLTGELAIRESGNGGRLLPASLFTRWDSDDLQPA